MFRISCKRIDAPTLSPVSLYSEMKNIFQAESIHPKKCFTSKGVRPLFRKAAEVLEEFGGEIEKGIRMCKEESR